MEEKIILFEYLVHRLIKWYEEIESNKRNANKHFTRLTTLKLLFFVSTIKDNNNNDLLDIFNNFCAMQYGPVEIDIYTAIVKNSITKYKFGNQELFVMNHDDKYFDTIISDLTNKTDRIDKAISLLKIKNPNIILYPASLLINISHKWEAWQEAISIAAMLGKRSENMSIESIRNNRQFYE